MQDHTSEIGRFRSGRGLEQVLLGRARVHVLGLALVDVAPPAFECPDCAGELACATCGEPTRRHVLDALQRRLRRRWPL